jgi:hypothetical protein
MGICTNKPERPTREMLRELRLAPYFQVVFGGDTVEGVKKPDPRLIHSLLDALGARPAEAVMVGDAANDVGAARAAGIPVILRAGGYTRVPAQELDGDRIITDLLEWLSVAFPQWTPVPHARARSSRDACHGARNRARAVAEQLQRESFVEVIKARSPNGVDLVYVTVGGDVLRNSYHVVNPGGALVSIVEAPDVEEARRLGIRATFLFVEPNGTASRDHATDRGRHCSTSRNYRNESRRSAEGAGTEPGRPCARKNRAENRLAEEVVA